MKRVNYPFESRLILANLPSSPTIRARLIKPCAEEELLKAANRALASSRETAQSRQDIIELRRRANSLGAREQQVVRLVVSGLLNKDIADALNLALITVKVHRGNAMRKLGAKRNQATGEIFS